MGANPVSIVKGGEPLPFTICKPNLLTSNWIFRTNVDLICDSTTLAVQSFYQDIILRILKSQYLVGDVL